MWATDRRSRTLGTQEVSGLKQEHTRRRPTWGAKVRYRYALPGARYILTPFRTAVPVLGTNKLLEIFEWFVPRNGTAVLKGLIGFPRSRQHQSISGASVPGIGQSLCPQHGAKSRLNVLHNERKQKQPPLPQKRGDENDPLLFGSTEAQYGRKNKKGCMFRSYVKTAEKIATKKIHQVYMAILLTAWNDFEAYNRL